MREEKERERERRMKKGDKRKVEGRGGERLWGRVATNQTPGQVLWGGQRGTQPANYAHSTEYKYKGGTGRPPKAHCVNYYILR